MELTSEGALECLDEGEALTTGMVDSSRSRSAVEGMSRVGGVRTSPSRSTSPDRRWARCSGDGSLPG